MRRAIIILFLSFISFVSTAGNLFDKYPVKKISQHVYVVHGPLQQPNPENRGFMNNPAFIVADNSVIVVDPGSSRETGLALLAEIKKITSKPVSHIFNTHVHGDHWLGNNAIKSQYPDVEIISDPRMLKKAKQGEAKVWMDMLSGLTNGATDGTVVTYPNKTVKDAEQLIISGLHFNIYSVGIAHSDSDIMIELVEDSLMFTGDNVSNERVLRISDGDFRDSISACDKAISLQLKHYVPGHGKTGDVNIVRMQRKYFSILYAQTEKYYADELESYEMKPMIVKSLTKFKLWKGFDEEVGKHISLAILEIEKAEFQ